MPRRPRWDVAAGVTGAPEERSTVRVLLPAAPLGHHPQNAPRAGPAYWEEPHPEAPPTDDAGSAAGTDAPTAGLSAASSLPTAAGVGNVHLPRAYSTTFSRMTCARAGPALKSSTRPAAPE